MPTNLTLKRGDTGKWDIAFTRKVLLNGLLVDAPADITGSVVRFTAKKLATDLDAVAVVRKDSAGVGGVVITNAGGGIARVTVPPGDSAILTDPITNLSWDAQITEQDGTVTTVLEGTLIVSADITQA